MLNLFKFLDQSLVGFLGVEPQLRAISDGRNHYRFVQELEVGGGYSFDGVAQNLESGDSCMSFLGEEVDVVGEGEFSV